MLHVSLPRVFKLKQAAGYIVHIQLSFGNKSQISALVKGEESALSNKCKVVATRTPLDLLDELLTFYCAFLCTTDPVISQCDIVVADARY